MDRINGKAEPQGMSVTRAQAASKTGKEKWFPENEDLEAHFSNSILSPLLEPGNTLC